jgi:hypothetical protein
MKYEDIKYFSQRCEEHPDHQSGMISNSMIQQRLHEEIDELREYIEQLQGEEHMNTCPNCGKVAGLHSSILQGCMCQYAMQAPAQRTWVGLEGEEIRNLWEEATKPDRSTMTMVTSFAKSIEAKLKQKNHVAQETN